MPIEAPGAGRSLEVELAGVGAGRPLVAPMRRQLEARIGGDFSGVRVHDGPRAHGLARRLRAAAFTVGRDIYFGRDRFRPERPSGIRLLAHELTHVRQQAGGGPRRLQRQTDDYFEEQRRLLDDEIAQHTLAGATAATPENARRGRSPRHS